MKISLSVEAAQKEILHSVRTLPTETVSLSDSLGCVLAQEIVASADLPRFTNSAMDGYAVRFLDVATATSNHPVTLRVIETIAAGRSPRKRLSKGQAAAVMTGGQIPKGADAVVVVEKTERHGGTVRILDRVHQGENIRQKGEIVRRGRIILQKNRMIGAVGIGVLATFNYSRIKVHRKPRVAIFSTGDEIISIGQKVPRGKIVDSNRHMILAELRRLGFIAINLGIVPDQKTKSFQVLRRAARNADAVITIGGVSMGEFDFVRAAIAKLGRLIFWKVRMKPGGPQTFGLIHGKPIFGLPGNPVSSLLVFRLFAEPALRKMAGQKVTSLQWNRGRLSEATRGNLKKSRFDAVRLDQRNGTLTIRPIASHGSHDLLSWLQSDGIIWLPAKAGVYPKGMEVSAIRWGS